MTQVNSIAVLPLGRPTFDVEFAEQQLASMLAALRATGRKLIGPECLLMDGDAAEAAIETAAEAEPDLVLVLQVTFTDAAVTARIAERFDTRLAIWAVPEPRLGGTVASQRLLRAQSRVPRAGSAQPVVRLALR